MNDNIVPDDYYIDYKEGVCPHCMEVVDFSFDTRDRSIMYCEACGKSTRTKRSFIQ